LYQGGVSCEGGSGHAGKGPARNVPASAHVAS
jgi:hypothetical protein